MTQENIHVGHRDRLKQEFMQGKLDKEITPHRLLELLLFFCIQRSDTNPLAHRLLDRYGSIANVLDAPVEELVTFKGLTHSNVVLLKLIIPVAQAYYADRQDTSDSFHNEDEIGKFLCDQYAYVTEEQFSILSLDGLGRKIDFKFVSVGDRFSVNVPLRKIMRHVLKNKASHVIMAHNHPNAGALPSKEDIEATIRLRAALSTIDVRLLDHIILSNGDYISLAQSRQFNHIFREDPSF